MKITKQRTTFLPIIVLLLYLVPNLVQDIHRVWGHPESQFGRITQNGIQLHSQVEKCPVCVFEFNIVDQLETTVYIPYLRTESFLFNSNQEHQFSKITFQYNNLRGPPKV